VRPGARWPAHDPRLRSGGLREQQIHGVRLLPSAPQNEREFTDYVRPEGSNWPTPKQCCGGGCFATLLGTDFRGRCVFFSQLF
jgi:hypothetical protein